MKKSLPQRRVFCLQKVPEGFKRKKETSAPHMFLFVFASVEQKTLLNSPALSPTGLLPLPQMMVMPATQSSQIQHTHTRLHL